MIIATVDATYCKLQYMQNVTDHEYKMLYIYSTSSFMLWTVNEREMMTIFKQRNENENEMKYEQWTVLGTGHLGHSAPSIEHWIHLLWIYWIYKAQSPNAILINVNIDKYRECSLSFCIICIQIWLWAMMRLKRCFWRWNNLYYTLNLDRESSTFMCPHVLRIYVVLILSGGKILLNTHHIPFRSNFYDFARFFSIIWCNC